MTKDEAMKLALEALEFFDNNVSNPAEKFITSKAIAALLQALLQPECNQHPDAPHGFNREPSHSLGRYVCDCEGWEPEEQEPVAWRNAAIRLGEDLYSVGPNGYYDMTANQWLDWALSVVNTAPPKPAQDLIVGYADSHDLNRAGHDFWVSRQPGKNTVPLYLYGHPPKIWQGLTDEEIIEHFQTNIDTGSLLSFAGGARYAEAKLKEKNT